MPTFSEWFLGMWTEGQISHFGKEAPEEAAMFAVVGAGITVTTIAKAPTAPPAEKRDGGRRLGRMPYLPFSL